MDLDNLKTTWQEYDRKLEKSLKLNEELLRQINLNQSRNELKTPLRWEYFSLITNFIVTLYVIILTIQYRTEVSFLLTGIATIILNFTFLWLNTHKIKILSSINYYTVPVIEVQKSVLNFEYVYQKAKKIELLLMPLLMVCLFILLFKVREGINVLEYPLTLIILTSTALLIAIPLSLWTYKCWYEKKIKKVYEFLNKIEEFEKE